MLHLKVTIKTLLTSGAIFVVGLSIWAKIRLKRRQVNLLNLRSELQKRLCYGRSKVTVSVIESEPDLKTVENFVKCAKTHKILGLDLEWVNNGKPSLMQLALPDGKCILVRLSMLKEIPSMLQQLLQQPDVIKLGVGIKQDCDKLLADYGVNVRSWVDIRHVVQPRRETLRSLGMASIAKTILYLNLDKDRKIRRSNWNEGDCDGQLSQKQIEYAANDALIAVSAILALAIEEFEYLSFWKTKEASYDDLVQESISICNRTREVDFTSRSVKTKVTQQNNIGSGKSRKISPEVEKRDKQSLIGHKPRRSPLYHNAKLQAPDGQPLCVCDTKKAAWYVAKGIGRYVDEEKLTVRLNFEPSGRPRGQAADYYLSSKDNCCVVCGNDDSYVRKYVVPHEYRRYFPSIMRNHQSHDILLMCIPCHKLGGFYDLGLRRKLGEICNAPVSDKEDTKMFLDADAKKIKAAARALVNDREKKIPEDRVQELQNIIKSYFPNKELTEELLLEASNMDSFVFNENFVPHGKKVVDFFMKEHNGEKGIVELEKMWRKHFLDTMRPQFLPPLWSVEHRQDWKFDT